MQPQTTDLARERILSADELVLIEAPAGHGKTHEAVLATETLSKSLRPGQRVLLLSHTNAARDELRARFSGSRLPAHAQTFDSLACEIVDTYTSHLGLARPFRPGMTRAGHPAFEEVRQHASDLIRRAPCIAEGLAWRYPVILADEFQDSTEDHKGLLWGIRSSGHVRMRLFGDRMQAIFGFSGDLVDWGTMVSEHGSVSLAHGYRWDQAPELRDWIAKVRTSLLDDEPITLADGPGCVRVHPWEGTAPSPTQKGYCPGCIEVLRRIRPPGQTAWLVRNRQHAYGLATQFPHYARLYEAGDIETPLDCLSAVQEAEGDKKQLAILLIDKLRAYGTGIQLDARRQLERICTEDQIGTKRSKKIVALAAVCDVVYEDPSIRGWLRAFRLAVEQRAEIRWRPVHRDTVYLLAGVPEDSEDPLLAVQALGQARRGRRTGGTAVMTVHKSKGREFDSVVIPYLSDASFGADAEGRRLLYVALTRATREIHLLVPSDRPSALIKF